MAVAVLWVFIFFGMKFSPEYTNCPNNNCRRAREFVKVSTSQSIYGAPS